MSLTLEDHPRSRAAKRPPAGAINRQRQRAAAAQLFAERGTGIPLSIIRTAAGATAAWGPGTYLSTADLLADLLTDHLLALSAAVAAAQDAAAHLPPEALLERLIRAYLDAVAAAPHAHRAFLFCTHHLPEEQRRALDLRLRIVIETMQAALAAAVPALAANPEAPLLLFPTIRAVLSDPFGWPVPPEAAQRQADGRRLAGMLIAAAEAEATGVWPRLGRVAGAEPGLDPIALTCRRARARFRDVLRAAEAGADVTITRRGKPVARVLATR